MRRARVTAVNGLKAQADGKWLNIIGNKTVVVGNFVWTDGRCIYGNFNEGGESMPIISANEPYVPIFMLDGAHCLYHKGSLKSGQQVSNHEWMVNRGNEVVFSDEDRAIDVSLDKSGGLQELMRERYAHANGALGFSFRDYGGDIGAKIGIYFEWVPRDYYWYAGRETESERLLYASILKEGARLAEEQVMKEILRQIPSNEAESMLVLPDKECRIIGGWYESEQDYCLFMESDARALYMSGRNLGIYDYKDRCWQADFGTLYSWSVEYVLELLAVPESLTVLRGRYNNNGYWNRTYLPVEGDDAEPCHFVDLTESIDMPLPDGFKLTMSRRNKERIEYDGYDADSYRYELKSAGGQAICDIDGYKLGKRVLACKLRPQSWLTSLDGKLYRVKNGKKQMVEGEYYHRNTRLRPMKNYSAWMKGD